jgi:hypothetical protein
MTMQPKKSSELARVAHQDHGAKGLLSGESSQRDRDQPATLHLDAGSTSGMAQKTRLGL